MTDIGVVDLAHTADFRLGDILVRPARRQLIGSCGKTELLQPRIMQVLVALAQAEGAVVTREELTQACWRGVTVGDDSINRVISQLRRAAETLGEGSFRIETVPKVGYRIDFPAPRRAASPAKTAPQSAFQLESLAAEPTQLQRRTSWVRSGWVIAVALIALLGAGVGLWNTGFAWPWSAGEGPYVAVASFDVNGGGEAAREMARAVASDSVSDLGAKSVQTIAVTSVSMAPRSVHLVLNGEVQQTPTDARVTLHLFDPHARAILWSGKITGDPTHLASLQQQASLKAADMLTCGLDAFAPKARLDAEARVLWLHMCDTWRQRGTLGQARDAMRALMQRVPSFSGAYAKYALATARMISNGSFSDVRAARDEARAAALHALELSPDDADAYIALSVTEPATDWLAREQWLRKGLAHQPNSSDLLSWQAALLATLGRPSEALPIARRGVELDPHSAVKTVNLAIWLSFAGEAAEAAKVEQAARLTWPQSPDVLDWEFEQAVRRGDAAAVLERLSSPQTRPVEMLDSEALLWPKIMAGRHGSTGDRLVLAHQIADLMERRQFNDFWGFLALHMLNEDDAAYALMLKLSKGGTGTVIPEDIATVLFQPEMASLRAQPRFMDLAANLGLTAYWLRSGRWPDFCSDPDLGYSCAPRARAAERAKGRTS